MRSNWLIWLLVLWGARARAQGNVEPSAPISDEELLKMSEAQAETIHIYDERPDKPFDRDTEVRLTGEQLAARGATDLSTALSLLPDVIVRDAGRGGLNVDIRGARKGDVTVLIDGVPVSDPFYGTFDVTSIPVTDIVEIRLSTTPQSPIDGVGGPGGVIEVHTRDAVGEQLVIARAVGDSLPTFGATGMARVALGKNVGLRISASGDGGAQGMPLPMNGTLINDNHAAIGSARLEVREGNARLAVDGFVADRHYLSPPSDQVLSAIVMVDREQTQYVTAKGDLKIGTLQLQAQAWTDHLYRRSRFFSDPALQDETSLENLNAWRTGTFLLATQPIAKDWRWAASATADHESADVGDMTGNVVHGDITLGELAGDLQYEHGTVRVDGAVGLAVPAGVGADPWPEAKLTGRWRPHYGSLELTATLGRKGRVPSLRERFDPQQGGNPKLSPEMADIAEVRAIETRGRLRIELAPFWRHTNGVIRLDPMTMVLENLGTVDFRGVDLLARVRVHPIVEVGGAYDYIDASAAGGGPNPLDRLPHHRGEAWVQATPDPRLTLLARVKYFGECVDQGVTLPANTTVDATATAPISKQYLAVLRVDDLFDARPLVRNDYHALGRIVTLVVQGQWQ